MTQISHNIITTVKMNNNSLQCNALLGNPASWYSCGCHLTHSYSPIVIVLLTLSELGSQRSTVPYLATDKVNDKRMNTKEHLAKKSGLFLWVVTKDKDKKCVNIRFFCYEAAYLLTKLVSSAPTPSSELLSA